MSNQTRPIPINNSFNICLEKDSSCQELAHREVNNMTKNMTNNQSKLKIFGMIITFPMMLMGGINPVLSVSLSQQLEIANTQSSWYNSLVSRPSNNNQNNYLNVNRTGIATQLTTNKSVFLESANFSEKFSEKLANNHLEIFLSSDYYSKDCRRRKVCDD